MDIKEPFLWDASVGERAVTEHTGWEVTDFKSPEVKFSCGVG